LRDDPPTPADNRLVHTGAPKYVPPNFTKRKKPNAANNYEKYLLGLSERNDFGSEFDTNPELKKYKNIGGKRKNNRKTKKRRKKGGNKGPIKKSRGRKNNIDPSKIPE